MIYCDPPYIPLSKTASFTTYSSVAFDLDDQALLARTARQTARKRGIAVLISNHDTPWAREIYHGARLHSVQVARSISTRANGRKKVNELLALYS